MKKLIFWSAIFAMFLIGGGGAGAYVSHNNAVQRNSQSNSNMKSNTKEKNSNSADVDKNSNSSRSLRPCRLK